MPREMSNTMQICELWATIIERMAAVHGAPLPKTKLKLGSQSKGWFVMLNNTGAEVDDVPEFSVFVEWNGFPAGIIDQFGGVLAAGDAANEDAFRKWLVTAR
jgi:hypothetical protein